jgi:hypothetical protein
MGSVVLSDHKPTRFWTVWIPSIDSTQAFGDGSRLTALSCSVAMILYLQYRADFKDSEIPYHSITSTSVTVVGPACCADGVDWTCS